MTKMDDPMADSRGWVSPFGWQSPVIGDLSWPVPLAPVSVPAALAGVAQGTVAPPVTHNVLVALGEPNRHIPLSPSIVSSARYAHIRYHITTTLVAPAGVARVDAIGGATPPKIILLDILVLHQPDGVGMLRRLKSRLPETHLLLGWSRTDAALDGHLLAQFNGSLAWSEFASLGHVLDATLAGELWFPRAVMQEMYRCALGTGRALQGAAAAEMSNMASAALTRREIDVYQLMRCGLTNGEIAERLEISVNTVKKHLSRVFEKRGLRARRQSLISSPAGRP